MNTSRKLQWTPRVHTRVNARATHVIMNTSRKLQWTPRVHTRVSARATHVHKCTFAVLFTMLAMRRCLVALHMRRALSSWYCVDLQLLCSYESTVIVGPKRGA